MNLQAKYLITSKTTIALLLLATLSWHFGLFHRFNFLAAKIDLAEGDPKIVRTGPTSPIETALASLNRKYGFRYYHASCTGTHGKFNGIKAYNAQVHKYLRKRNGENWKMEYLAEYNALLSESD